MVTTVTPEREGALGLRAALPTDYATKGFVFNIGSANRKISWYADGEPRVQDTFGSKYCEKNVDDATVAAAIKAKAAAVPASLRGTCFIVGGAPYELAKAVRQGQEPFTVLKAPTKYPQLNGAKVESGLNAYQALAEATGCQQVVFGHDTNFIIGYLLSLWALPSNLATANAPCCPHGAFFWVRPGWASKASGRGWPDNAVL